jgi:hypothetical protein
MHAAGGRLLHPMKFIVVALELCLDCTGTLGVIASLLEVGDGS